MSRRQHRFDPHSSQYPSSGEFDADDLSAWNWETASAPIDIPVDTHVVVFDAAPRLPIVSVIVQSFLYTYDEVIHQRLLSGYCTETTADYIRSCCVDRLETSLRHDSHNDRAHLWTIGDRSTVWHMTLAWTAAGATMAANGTNRQIVFSYEPNPHVWGTDQVAVSRADDQGVVLKFDTYALGSESQEVFRDHDDIPLSIADCQNFGVISTDEEQL